MAARLRPGDNGAVKASRPAWVIDTAIAVAATLAAVWAAIALGHHDGAFVVHPGELPHPAVPAGLSAWVVLGIALTDGAARVPAPVSGHGVRRDLRRGARDARPRHHDHLRGGDLRGLQRGALQPVPLGGAAGRGHRGGHRHRGVPGHHAAGTRPVHRAAGAGADRRRGGRDARVAAAGRGFGRTAAPGRGRARGADPAGGRGGAGPDRRRTARRRDPQRERDGGAGGRGPQRARQLTRRCPGGPAGRGGERADRDE